MAIFIGVVKVVMVGVAMIVMDKVGRKTLLLFGLLGMVVTVFTLATVTVASEDTTSSSVAVVATISLLF